MANTREICQIVRDAEQNLLQGNTNIGKYVSLNSHEIIEKIDAYLNSRHISGDTDSLGREKPFFNIVSSAVNIWYRATDLDRKDLRILPSKIEETALAFIATVHLQDWMKKARFGVFLNDWGRSLARYGSSIVKFVEQGGELVATVIPWNRFIFDPVDFDAIPHIEKFYKTEEQLYEMVKDNGYDAAMVEALCEAVATRKTLDKQNQDSQGNFIELYEVHGRLSKATYLKSKGKETTDEDEDIYFQQMHVVSFVSNGKKYDDFTLYSGKEKKDPYMVTHLIKEDGRTLAIGAVEYLFDAQWMQNHTVKNMKDTLDIASKLIFQTADSRYVGRNILSAIETGDIFIFDATKAPSGLTRVANDKPDIGALQNFGTMWQELSRELTSTPDAIRGNTLPSGTPYSLGSLLAQQGSSLFEIMTENKGLALEDMMREYVIPFLKTQMDTKDEIIATLDSSGISEIDAMYVPNEAARRFNKNAVAKVMQALKTNDNSGIPSPYQPQLAQQSVQDELALLGNKRVFRPDDLDNKTWDSVLKDFEWRVDVQITNENADKQAVMTTLNTVFQTLANNPYALANPNVKMVFDAILTETGRISPIQLAQVNAPTARMPNVRLNETIDFADLPPDGKQQMAGLAGIQIQPPQPAPVAAPPLTALSTNAQ